jgi:AraC family transcriptional regulator
MSHRPELERALRFVAAHLERSISVAEVARAAHLSEFHLQRAFHAEVGESLARFVTRRGLELAALRLVYETTRSITDVALSCGYSSSANFERAFASYFGCCPSRVREQEPPEQVASLAAQHGKSFSATALYALPPELERAERKRMAAEWEARVRYETVPARAFACLASPAGYDLEANDQTWRELVRRVRQLGLASGAVDAWGIAHDSPNITAPENCRFLACVPCPVNVMLPTPLFRGDMAAGRYAVFRYQGSAAGVAAAYRSVYACWFSGSSVSSQDFYAVGHYVSDFPAGGPVDMELWFRVRTRYGAV